MEPNLDLNTKLQERFQQLPKKVQLAITSADVEKHLRELSDTHKLHVDQWATLENEVMLALLGFQKVEDLAQNLEKQIGLSHETATALAADISKIVFEPIRTELEQELKQPEAGATGEDAAPKAAPDSATPTKETSAPATTRTAISETYKPGSSSSERKDVHSDPYRESPA